jgi:hypothetical protein
MFIMTLTSNHKKLTFARTKNGSVRVGLRLYSSYVARFFNKYFFMGCCSFTEIFMAALALCFSPVLTKLESIDKMRSVFQIAILPMVPTTCFFFAIIYHLMQNRSQYFWIFQIIANSLAIICELESPLLFPKQNDGTS